MAADTLRKSFLEGIPLLLAFVPAIGAQYSEAVKKKVTINTPFAFMALFSLWLVPRNFLSLNLA